MRLYVGPLEGAASVAPDNPSPLGERPVLRSGSGRSRKCAFLTTEANAILASTHPESAAGEDAGGGRLVA
jgi:hypothetical protein